MNGIEALLMGAQPDQMQSLADQLRRQQRLGRMFSASSIPDVAAAGKRDVINANMQAREIGGQRARAGLQKARQKFQQGQRESLWERQDTQREEKRTYEEKIAEQNYLRGLGGDAAKQQRDMELIDARRIGPSALQKARQEYEAGRREDLWGREDTQREEQRTYDEGIGERDYLRELGGDAAKQQRYLERIAARKAETGPGRTRAGDIKEFDIVGTDASYFKNIVTGAIDGHDGVRYENQEAYAAAYPELEGTIREAEAREATAKAEGTFKDKAAKKAADFGANNINKAWGALDSAPTTTSTLNEMVDAIRSGAWVGGVDRYFPTIRAKTKFFESMENRLALGMLDKYKLYPLSDKDIKILKSSAAPEIGGEEFIGWADAKINALKRFEAAQELMVEYLVETGGKRPIGAAKKNLEAQMKAAADTAGPETSYFDAPPATAAQQNDGLDNMSLEELRRLDAQ
jgi:hypothetical protein